MQSYCDLREAISMEKRYFTSALRHSLISLVDLLYWDDFYVGSDVISAAKVKHLLRFGNTSDVRAGETATLEYKTKVPQHEAWLVRLQGSCCHRGAVIVGMR